MDSLTRTLNLQAPPNDGVQQPRGEVARSLPVAPAFDILTDGQGSNRGFLLAEGTLHDVDLQSGRRSTATLQAAAASAGPPHGGGEAQSSRTGRRGKRLEPSPARSVDGGEWTRDEDGRLRRKGE